MRILLWRREVDGSSVEAVKDLGHEASDSAKHVVEGAEHAVEKAEHALHRK